MDIYRGSFEDLSRIQSLSGIESETLFNTGFTKKLEWVGSKVGGNVKVNERC